MDAPDPDPPASPDVPVPRTTPASDEPIEAPAPPTGDSIPRRLHRALSPIAAGMILDLADVATFGPVGVYGGFVVGAAVGWWLGGLEGLGRKGRAVLAVLSGIYLCIPMTEPLPIATTIGAIARFLREPRDDA